MKYGFSEQEHSPQSEPTVKRFPGGMPPLKQGFEKLMATVFDKDVFAIFKASHQIDYVDMMNELEIKIKTFSEETDRIPIKVPASLMSIYKDVTGKNIKETIRNLGDYKLVADKLILPSRVFIVIFEEFQSRILNHIKTETDNGNVKYIIMFGNLAQSPLIQKTVKTVVQSIKVLSEEDILSGAIIAGEMHKPGQIVKMVILYVL